MNLIALMSLVTLTLHVQTPTPRGPALNTCTAVYIGPTTALTAAHCVRDYHGKAWVKTNEGKSFKAVLITADPLVDLALLDIKGPAHDYTQLGKGVDRGDKVYILSSEDDMIGTYGEGLVENLIADEELGTPFVIHSVGILPGASGSGLFDRRGQLVGINVAILRSVSQAVDVSAINYFLTCATLKGQICAIPKTHATSPNALSDAVSRGLSVLLGPLNLALYPSLQSL